MEDVLTPQLGYWYKHKVFSKYRGQYVDVSRTHAQFMREDGIFFSLTLGWIRHYNLDPKYHSPLGEVLNNG